MLRLKEENWDAVIDTDLKSGFLTMKAAAPIMMKQKKARSSILPPWWASWAI